METVVEDLQRFKDVTPVLALVVQSLIQHIHNFVEVCRATAEQILEHAISTRELPVNGEAYLPNVMAAISAMSVPVGPQGSLLVATWVNQHTAPSED